MSSMPAPPVLSPPRSVRLAAAALADRMEPGERIWMTEGVRTGSLLAYLAVALSASLLWIVTVALTVGDHVGVFGEGVVKLIGFAAIVLVASRRFVKFRRLVLTDRRLFLCRVTWFLGRPSEVELEIPRSASISVTVRKRDRLVSVEGGSVPIGFRGTPYLVSSLERWADV